MDSTKPDGTMRKLMDVSKLKNVGWSYKIDLQQGISQVYKQVLEQKIFE
jgi:GDP-L-fucose synthase